MEFVVTKAEDAEVPFSASPTQLGVSASIVVVLVVVAFLVLTPQTVYGMPVSPDLVNQAKNGQMMPESFGLSPDQLRVVVIAPDGNVDLVGVVTALEGEPLPSGDIASQICSRSITMCVGSARSSSKM